MPGRVVILTPEDDQHHLLVTFGVTLCGQRVSAWSVSINLEAARRWTRACKVCFPDDD